MRPQVMLFWCLEKPLRMKVTKRWSVPSQPRHRSQTPTLSPGATQADQRCVNCCDVTRIINQPRWTLLAGAIIADDLTRAD